MAHLAECISSLVLHPEDPKMLTDMNYLIQKRNIFVSVNQSLRYPQDNYGIESQKLNLKSEGLV